MSIYFSKVKWSERTMEYKKRYKENEKLKCKVKKILNGRNFSCFYINNMNLYILSEFDFWKIPLTLDDKETMLFHRNITKDTDKWHLQYIFDYKELFIDNFREALKYIKRHDQYTKQNRILDEKWDFEYAKNKHLILSRMKNHE